MPDEILHMINYGLSTYVNSDCLHRNGLLVFLIDMHQLRW